METFSNLGVSNNQFDVYASRNFMTGVSKFIGRHNLKAGFDYRRMSITGITFGNNAGLFAFSHVFTRANVAAADAGMAATWLRCCWLPDDAFQRSREQAAPVP
ncbi:MAG TPA: hypothetical protein VES20_01410 [Bryobacteraceae bacterium]|nr:hypothetical protein [Bryobacteraceae bacterium]